MATRMEVIPYAHATIILRLTLLFGEMYQFVLRAQNNASKNDNAFLLTVILLLEKIYAI